MYYKSVMPRGGSRPGAGRKSRSAALLPLLILSLDTGMRASEVQARQPEVTAGRDLKDVSLRAVVAQRRNKKTLENI